MVMLVTDILPALPNAENTPKRTAFIRRKSSGSSPTSDPSTHSHTAGTIYTLIIQYRDFYRDIYDIVIPKSIITSAIGLIL